MLYASDGDSASLKPRRAINVLIVEDDRVNQQQLREMLTPLGFDVALADNGRQAVNLVQDGTIDIVLMDLQMPEMDGFQATKAIRELSRLKSETPVIAVTSLSRQADREACLMAGISDYLPKPVDKTKLLLVLETWLRIFRPELPPFLELPSPMPANSQSTPTDLAPDATSEVMLLEVALARMGNDRTLLLQLAEFFLEDAPKLLAEIDSGVKADELAIVSRAAHSLKGLAANFEAIPAVAAARRVEEDGKQQEMAKLPADISALQAEIDKLMQALETEVSKSKG